MQRCGLSAAAFDAYVETLLFERGSAYLRRIRVKVLTLDGDEISTLTPVFVSGTVAIDCTQGAETPARILDFTFADPFDELGFSTSSAGDAPMTRDKIVQVWWDTWVDDPLIGDWVECPVFTGIVWAPEKKGAMVRLVAHGLERQLLGNAHSNARTYRAKLKKSYVLRDMAQLYGGETNMVIPWLKGTLPKRVVVKRMDKPWVHMQKIADSMDRQLFYDGAGVLRLRPLGEAPNIVLSGRHLTEELSLGSTNDGRCNTFVVKGKDPEGNAPQVHGNAMFKPSWEDSAWAWQRNGALHWVVDEYTNDKIGSNKVADRIAARRMRNASKRVTDVSFNCAPLPFADEGDVAAVRSPFGPATVRLRSWTLPIDADGTAMTVASKRWSRENPSAA